MPRSAKRSTHAELDELRQDVVRQRVKARDLDVALEAAKLEVEQASGAVTDAYEVEDGKLVQQRRKQLESAEGKVIDLGHQVVAAGQRVERAQHAVDAFTAEHARDLLDERANDARELALSLTRVGHELIRLHRAYLSMRTDIDSLVGAIPGAVVRSDGSPPRTHGSRSCATWSAPSGRRPRRSPRCRDGRASSTASSRTASAVVSSCAASASAQTQTRPRSRTGSTATSASTPQPWRCPNGEAQACGVRQARRHPSRGQLERQAPDR